MKDYHFQENEQDFGKTVRLDDINEKVKKLEEGGEDDLGDARAFLNAFESEKFDAPEEPASEGAEHRRRVREEKFKMDKKTMGILALAAVLACILGFAAVRWGFQAEEPPVAVAGEPFPMLAESISEEWIKGYDITAAERKTILLTEETLFLDENGQESGADSIHGGDVAVVTLSEDGETALSIDCGGDGISTREATGLAAEESAGKLIGEKDSYAYGKQAMFLYREEELSPKDLEPCDLLELTLVDDVVWSVQVLEYHGYIEVENAKNIKDGKIRLDEEEELPLEEGMKLAVRAGQHQVTVTGSNIEQRTDTLFVEAGEDLEYDLSKAQEKMGVIIIDANVTDYKLYINGAAAESPAVLPMGEYDVVILKNGYMEWNQHVTLAADSVTLHAELLKDIQYGTLTVTADVEGAWVYINGEEYGVAPMEVNLPYGTYHVQVEKEDYETFRQSVSIHSAAASLHATLE
ncbi:MAG: PEGA domain-containing protein [Bacillota bacterium]|nr:PEGA domain-containing protein [Bacillota bacterium]